MVSSRGNSISWRPRLIKWKSLVSISRLPLVWRCPIYIYFMHLDRKDEKACKVGPLRTEAKAMGSAWLAQLVYMCTYMYRRIFVGRWHWDFIGSNSDTFQNFNLNYGGSHRVHFLRQCNAAYILLKLFHSSR